MKKYQASASCRIDLSGGTVDLWPLYLYTDGLQLVNMALPIKSRCVLTHRKSSDFSLTIKSQDFKSSRHYNSIETLFRSLNESSRRHPNRWLARLAYYFLKDVGRGKFEMETLSESPPSSGLGGSSAMGVAVHKAFQQCLGIKTDRWEIQKTIRNLEAQELEHPTGDQDYVPALFGGLLIFHLNSNKKFTEKLDKGTEKNLRSRISLLHTRVPHHSGLNNWQVFKSLHEGDKTILRTLKKIALISEKLAEELRNKRTDQIHHLINEEWKTRKRLAPNMDASVYRPLWEIGKKHGAIARKACGSGGGGCFFLLFKTAEQKKEFESILPSKYALPLKI